MVCVCVCVCVYGGGGGGVSCREGEGSTFICGYSASSLVLQLFSILTLHSLVICLVGEDVCGVLSLDLVCLFVYHWCF